MFVYRKHAQHSCHTQLQQTFILTIDYFKCVLISSFACVFTNIFLLNENIENIHIIIIGVIKAL
jgi:hypothetical protein